MAEQPAEEHHDENSSGRRRDASTIGLLAQRNGLEYGLITAMIAIAITGTLCTVGGRLTAAFGSVE
jgi:hypothetical protein